MSPVAKSDAEIDACFERHLRLGAWEGLKEAHPVFAHTLIESALRGDGAQAWRDRLAAVAREFSASALTRMCVKEAIEYVFTLSRAALAAEQAETALLCITPEGPRA